MDTVTKKIDLKALDKSNWPSFKFEEIAQKISKTVKPEEAEVDIYVGLEHIDGNDIHIHRKGSPEDVKGGKLRCYPGDVIFGKRRAYLRKAAIVDFDGICSAHAFVLRANPEVIDPKLFPFFLHSDQFMHRMVDISVGGLSPTINWGDLKHQEFKIPPFEIQKSFSEILRSQDMCLSKNKNVCERLNHLWLSVFDSIINNDFKTAERTFPIFEKKKLNEILSIPNKEKAVNIDRNKILTVRLHLKGVVKNTTVDGLKLGATTYYKRKSGQFIYGKQNLFNGAIGIVPNELDNFLSSSDIPSLDINEKKVLSEYLLSYFGRSSFYTYLEKHSSGSGSKRIGEKKLLELEIVLPELEDQIEIMKIMSKISNSIENSEKKIASSQSLQKSLINQIF